MLENTNSLVLGTIRKPCYYRSLVGFPLIAKTIVTVFLEYARCREYNTPGKSYTKERYQWLIKYFQS
jgi:hypothetical protein